MASYRANIPLCTIYGLTLNGKVVYVGQTWQLERRLYQHEYSGRQFDDHVVLVEVADTESAREMEAIYQVQFGVARTSLLQQSEYYGGAVTTLDLLEQHFAKEERRQLYTSPERRRVRRR